MNGIRCDILKIKEFFVMRIIAGELKGRRLASPSDNRVRPTTDKVKEAVFSMISGYLQDSIVLDLFSGTGNLGLEAISRGAARVYFADRDRTSVALTKDNIRHCRVEDRAEVLHADYISVLNRFQYEADVIFLDPPYEAGYLENCLRLIGEKGILAEDGIVVAEHSHSEILPETVAGLVLIKTKRYGKISISLYERQEEL